MDSVTATPDSANRSILLEAVAPVGAVTWTRYIGGGQESIGTGPALRDYPPFGVTVTYTGSDDNTTEVTDPLTLPDPPLPVLTAPLTGVSRDTVVVSQPPLMYESRSVAHYVLGRPDPVVTLLTPRYPTGTIRLYAPTRQEREALRDLLLNSKSLLLLRRPQSCADAVDDLTLLVTDVTEELVAESAPAGARYIDLDYQATERLTSTPIDPTWTYGAVVVAHADYAAVAAAYSTYGTLAAGAAL